MSLKNRGLQMRVAPSLLAADSLNFFQEVSSVLQAGADFLHIDVMDGHFVPNLSFGLPIIKALKARFPAKLDVHIMVSNPDDVAESYVKAGADLLTFHIEAAMHPVRIAQSVAEYGAIPGIALNPGTPISLLEPLLPYIGMVNMMSVNPGFGGQKFLEPTLERIRQLGKLCHVNGVDDMIIQVDGGITDKNISRVAQAGANLVVAGTYIFGSELREQRVQSLQIPLP